MTLKGELVRSYSEKVMADWFYRNGVRVLSLYPGDLHDLGSAIGSRLGQG